MFKNKQKTLSVFSPSFLTASHELTEVIASLFPVIHLFLPTTLRNIFLHSLSKPKVKVIQKSSTHYPHPILQLHASQEVKKCSPVGNIGFFMGGNGAFYNGISHNMSLNDSYIIPNSRHFLMCCNFFPQCQIWHYNLTFQVMQPKFIYVIDFFGLCSYHSSMFLHRCYQNICVILYLVICFYVLIYRLEHFKAAQNILNVAHLKVVSSSSLLVLEKVTLYNSIFLNLSLASSRIPNIE